MLLLRGVLHSHSLSKIIKRGYATKPPFSLEGVYTPIITPFDSTTQKLALNLYKENISKLTSTKINGLVVLGSNGEFPLLSYQEKVQVLSAAIEANRANGNKKHMIAGTGAVSTQETIDLTIEAAKMGYDAAMVVTPYYYTTRMSSAILRDHFTAVADKSPIPILLYNVPPFTGITIPVDLIGELSMHRNIIGVKDTTGSIMQISETARKVGKEFVVMAGSGGYFLQSLISGAKGGVMAISNILPNESVELWELYKANKLVEAQDLQSKLVVVNDIAGVKFGIGGLKYACELCGLHGGDPRAPLPKVTTAQKEEIKKALQLVGK